MLASNSLFGNLLLTANFFNQSWIEYTGSLFVIIGISLFVLLGTFAENSGNWNLLDYLKEVWAIEKIRLQVLISDLKQRAFTKNTRKQAVQTGSKITAFFIGLVAILVVISSFKFGAPLRAEAAAVPTVTTSYPTTGNIGETISFTVTFSNPGTNPGFGPFVDIIVPTIGNDGAGLVAIDDGLTITTSTYLGTNINRISVVFPETGVGCLPGLTPVNHPIAVTNTGTPVVICGTPGNTLVTMQLPFGSFVPSQPNAVINIGATISNLADSGAPLTIQTRGGFRYGNDALNNFVTDPSLVGVFASSSLTPSVFSISKAYNGPESETATGPNFPRRYTVTANIANGQTITNLDLADKLPPQAVFSSVISSSPAGATITASPITTAPTLTPNNLLNLRFPSVTGGPGAVDAQFVFEYYIPDRDASSNFIINHTTGDTTNVVNDALGNGNWVPTDTRDPVSPVTSDATLNDHTLAARSIATQKSFTNLTNPGNNRPGDVIQYTINFQISDYFAFNGVVLSDIMSDGQTFSPSFTPTLTVNELGATTSGNMLPANFNAVKSTGFIGATGLTTATFNISNELVSRGGDNQIRGGCSQNVNVSTCTTNSGAATGTLVFRATINDAYTDAFGTGDPSLSMGDTLSNTVTITGNVLNNGAFTPTGQTESNGSGVTFDITLGSVEKTVYAINGSTTFPSPLKVGPGDSITYRLSYNLSLTDTENFFFEDYLPLPVLNATGFNTTFNATVSAAAPVSGTAKFGPADTFFGISGITPTITVTPAQNRIRFDYGGFQDPLNRVATAEILITLTAANEPFANGLNLTNQLRASATNTFSAPQISDGIVQFELLMPDVNIRKGVVATNNVNSVFSPVVVAPQPFNAPGSPTCTAPNHRFTGNINSSNLTTTPIDSNLTLSDAGDIVTYAITLENTGQSPRGAYDLRVKDILPAGMQVPISGLNLCATRGDGTVIPFTAVNGADPVPFLGSGINLTDPSSLQGALTAYDPLLPTTGTNVIIITYDLQLTASVQPRTTITNAAELLFYSASDGGTANFVPNNSIITTATVATSAPSQTKVLTSTNQPLSTDPNVFVGEIATYTLTTTIPEGQMNSAVITDNLDTGLVFVNVVSMTPSSGVTTSVVGGFPQVITNTAITNSGTTINWNFGTITNSNTVNTTPETITIVYRAVVINNASNNRGTGLNNSAFLSYNNGAAVVEPVVSAPNVVILEPTLALAKTNAPTTGDANDLITYTLTVSHTGASNSPAFEVSLTDVIPTSITYQTGTLLNTAGVVPTTLTEASGTITATWTQLNVGQTSTFTFQGRPINTVIPAQVITNTGTVRWSSLPGNITTPQSTFSAVSTERTGLNTDPGGAVNDNTVSTNSTFTVNNVVTTKTLVSTSESFTGNVAGVERVAIGEIVRYRLATTIPEGAMTNFRVRDNIPTGLQYLNDGTARVGFSSNGNLTSTIPAFGTCNQVGSSGTITPGCVIPGAQITGGPFVDGTDPTFNFGNISNTDNDANSEFIVIEMNALVLNDTTNQAFTQSTGAAVTSTRNNTHSAIQFSPLTSADVTVTSGNFGVQIAEPLIRNLAKTLITTPVDANDPFTYQLTFSNTASGSNATNAYEIRLLDTLDSRLVLSSVNVVSVPGGTVVTNNSNIPANLVDLEFSQLLPGGTVTIQVSGNVISGAGDGQIIPNTGNLTYTSLPGTGTTGNPTGSNTPNTGTTDRERRGSGVPVQDDYNSTSTVNFTLSSGSINKTVVGGSNYRIGELVTFNLRSDVAEGVNNNLRVRDTMPAGLEYVSHSVISTAAGSGGLLTSDFSTTLPAPTFTQVGQQLNYNFGNVTLPADNNTTNNSFLVQIVMRVRDVVGNQNNTTLINNADLITFNTATSADQTVADPTPPSITVIVPILGITKTFVPSSAAPNDVVTIQLVVANTGGAAANDVTITDIVDKTRLINSTLAITPGGFTGNIVSIPATDTVSYTGGTINAGSSSTFTFTAQLVSSLANGTIVPNTGTITAASTMPGTVTGERTFGPINSTANLTVQTPDIRVTKTNGVTSVIPGQTVVYNVTVTNIGSYRADNIVVTETVPPNSTFNATSSLPTVWTPVLATYQRTIATLNPGQSTILNFAVTINSTVPSGFISFNNTASAVDDGTHGNDPTPANNTGTDNDPVNAAPDIVATKTDGVTLAAPGDTLTYTLTISNNGNQDATGVVVTDTIPIFSSYQSSSNSGTFATGVVTFPSFSLAAGSSSTRTVTVQVNPSIPSGINTITNIVNAVDDGLNGADLNPLNNTSNDIDSLNAEPDLTITKTDGLTTVSPSGSIAYTLTITNNGNQDATGVVVTDTIPASTSYVSSSNSGNFSLGVVTWPGFNLAVGATVTRTVNLTVNSTVPSGLNSITNNANVTDDLTNGPDTNPLDNVASDVDVLNAQPDLRITKTDSQTNTVPGQTLTYILTVSNTGNQDATGILVTETVPNNSTFVATGSSSWSCPDGSVAGTSCTLTIPNLAAGANTNLTFRTLVNSTIPTGINNIVNNTTVADDGLNGADPTPANNSASDTDILDAFPDLIVTKTDGVTELQPGQTTTYTLTITNQGNQTATGVAITDTLPANITFVSADNGGVEASGIISWPLITLNPGQNVVYSVVVTVVSPIPSGVNIITNTVNAVDDLTNGADPSPLNNTATDVDDIIAVPELSINIDDLGITTTTDGIISYAINYDNTGVQNATGVVASISIPANTTFVASGSTAGWSCSDGDSSPTVCNFTIGNLNVGQTGNLIFNVKVNSTLPAGVNDILANISITDDGTNGVEANLVNNQDSETTPVTATPDLTITKTDGLTTVSPSGSIAYTLTITNNGNQDATGVVVTDTIPASTSYVSSSNSGNFSLGVVTWPGFNLAVGATVTRTVNLTVNSTVPSGLNSITNTANVTDDLTNGPDTNPLDNVASDTDTVEAAPDLVITKTDFGALAIPATIVNYTIFYSNNGNQNATGVVITETVPLYSTFISAGSDPGWSCPDNSPSGTVCTLLVGNLNAGNSGSTTFNVQIDSTLPTGVDQIDNNYSITDDGNNGIDSNLTNNQGTEITGLVAAPDLAISKVADLSSVSPTDILTYTISYSNNGTQTATGVVITETVPLYATFSTTGSTSGWSCPDNSPSGTVCTLALGNQLSGATGTAIFKVQIIPSLPATIDTTSNTVSIADDGFNGADENPTNNQETINTNLVAAPDLEITKTDNLTSLNLNDPLTYTLTIRNIGTQDATGVLVTDTLPNYLSSIVISDSGVNNTGIVTWPLFNLNVGDTVTRTISAVFNPGSSIPSGLENLTNSVVVADDGTNGSDLNILNNNAEDTDTVNGNPDLEITIDDGLTILNPGQQTIYNIEVKNVGIQDASGTVVVVPMPVGMSYYPVNSTPGWVCTITECTFPLGNMLSGQTQNLEIAFIVASLSFVDTIPVTANVNDDGQSGADPTPLNNTDTDTDQILGNPELEISKMDFLGSISAGQTTEYTISVTNNGNIISTGVTITDNYDAELTFVSSDIAPASVDTNTREIIWNNLTVNPGQTIVILAQFSVNNPVPAGKDTVINSATVADDGTHGPDLILTNNQSSDTDNLDAAPDLVITEILISNNPYQGQVLEYELSYVNIGTQNSTGSEISVVIPDHTVYETTPGWVCPDIIAGTTCKYYIGNLNVGDPAVVIPFKLKINTGFKDLGVTIALPANIYDDGNNGTEITMINNLALVSTPLPYAELSLIKEVDKTIVKPQEILVYDFIYRNHGPDTATEINMVDILPIELEYISSSQDGIPFPVQVSTLPDGRTKLTYFPPDLAPGVEKRIRVVTKIVTVLSATLTNEASIWAREVDPDLYTNRDNISVSLSGTRRSPTIYTLLRTGGATIASGMVLILSGVALIIWSRSWILEPKKQIAIKSHKKAKSRKKNK